MAPPKPPPGEQYHLTGEGKPAENSRFGDDYPSFALVQEQIIKAMIEWEKAPQPAYLQPSQGWPSKESDFFCTDEDPYATAGIECKQYGPCSCTFHIWNLEKAAQVQVHPVKYSRGFPGPADKPSVALRNRRQGAKLYTGNRIRADQFIGRITGQIRPRGSKIDLRNPDVRHWPFGRIGIKHVFGRIAVLDSTRHGNMLKFLRHSCDPNCIVINARVALYSGLFVRTVRDIEAAEPLTFCDKDNFHRPEESRGGCIMKLTGKQCVCAVEAHAAAEKLATLEAELATAFNEAAAAQAIGTAQEAQWTVGRATSIAALVTAAQATAAQAVAAHAKATQVMRVQAAAAYATAVQVRAAHVMTGQGTADRGTADQGTADQSTTDQGTAAQGTAAQARQLKAPATPRGGATLLRIDRRWENELALHATALTGVSAEGGARKQLWSHTS
jgi:hypothetical protein